MAAEPHTRAAAERRGRWAERLSCWALRLNGWRVLDTRWRSPRGSGAGELDIIAARGRTLAFIEVKARETATQAMEAVSADQQTRIARGAEAYLAAHSQYAGYAIRFDVMIVRPWRWPRRIADAWRP